MGFWGKIAGTLEDWFGLDGESEVAIGRDGSGNLVFKDQIVSGTKTLTELLAAGTFDPDLLVLTTDGGLVYDNDGEPVLKENP